MATEDLADRVVSLERQTERLDALPDRVSGLELQFVQFRGEARDEFSAVRREMRAQGEELRAEMRAQGEELRAEMRALGQQLRAEIQAGDEQTRHLMRILHEDVITRIATIQEGRR